jgi:hypothetical protein
MQAQAWGLKTFYYSLINKKGAKADIEPTPEQTQINGVQVNGFHFEELEDDCEACKL